MANIFNEDFRDFIAALNNNHVKYILVGGFAVILHGHSRVTGDMDIWIKPTEENYIKLVSAFKEFGMSLFDMTKSNFLSVNKFDVFSFGRKPVAIDIMTKVKGLNFDEAYQQSKIFNDDGLLIRALHFNDLILAKRESGRLKDIDDIDQLNKE
ncbi:MAG TPA: nucleotidyltransferase [Parafilimonas sp.]|nr:nucleotidyltransferase [Parafilimonas sp.]